MDKVSKIIDIYDNYHDLYEQAENGIGSTLLSLVGGEDNVAASSTSPTTTSPRG